MKNKIVYVTMGADLLHVGHIDFLRKAKTFGNFVIVGLHPDDVLEKYKRYPIIPYEQRSVVLSALKTVDMIVPDCLDYRSPTTIENLKRFQVDIIVHGRDWLPPVYTKIKKANLCKVKIVDYYPNVSTTKIIHKIRNISNKKNWRSMLPITLVSAGDAITAKLVEEAGFGGIWISGFEASARKGLVDNGTLTMTEMYNIAITVVDATDLPVFIDIDSGYGGLHQAVRAVKAFEHLGAVGVCIEDNIFPKTNSLWGGKIPLLSKEKYGNKIKACKDAQKTSDFAIIARTEALVRGYGMYEALDRANYYADCGADLILIHSRDSSGNEALSIPDYWNRTNVPLVIVPTKFPHISISKLYDLGFSIIIFANQLERVKIKAVRKSLMSIKQTNSILDVETTLSSDLDDLRALTPVQEVQRIDDKYKD